MGSAGATFRLTSSKTGSALHSLKAELLYIEQPRLPLGSGMPGLNFYLPGRPPIVSRLNTHLQDYLGALEV